MPAIAKTLPKLLVMACRWVIRLPLPKGWCLTLALGTPPEVADMRLILLPYVEEALTGQNGYKH
jgi:hypothetical protein